ncbi:MAG TPA: hypothetical protein DCR51_04770 [Idiomarina loihiensis]|nr:hypothetical protein [Idiomarinaceae bacterium]HAS22455.1 hypothetical protein [Idiomarina loihiensis]
MNIQDTVWNTGAYAYKARVGLSLRCKCCEGKILGTPGFLLSLVVLPINALDKLVIWTFQVSQTTPALFSFCRSYGIWGIEAALIGLIYPKTGPLTPILLIGVAQLWEEWCWTGFDRTNLSQNWATYADFLHRSGPAMGGFGI